jgi:hypothetical protein
MSTLETRLRDLATRIGTESKALRTLINGNLADLSGLQTAAKTNLVAALNELQTEINAIVPGAAIDDASTVANKTWSSTKINDAITTAINVLTTGAPVALNTLDELSAALGDDANFATTITTALGNRVRTDTAAQGLTAQQKTNARTNIGADVTSTETGNTDADLVAAFNAALV